MKYMGWSWHELMATPQSVVNEIVAIMADQAEDAELERLKNAD
jgi:hypothetical protein